MHENLSRAVDPAESEEVNLPSTSEDKLPVRNKPSFGRSKGRSPRLNSGWFRKKKKKKIERE